MKYIIDFEDVPFVNSIGTRLYRIKGSTSVCVPSSYLNHFPKYEEPVTSPKMSEKDDGRLKELENLKEGDVVIATNDFGGIRRIGLVIFVYSGEEDPYEIVSNYGAVMRRSAKTLFELDYHKANRQYTTEEFFSKSIKATNEVRDEAAEELSNLQPGDIIYRNLKGGALQRRIVNYVFPRHDCYEFINESGWKVRCNLPNLIDEGWRKLNDDLTTKEFYWKMRGDAYL